MLEARSATPPLVTRTAMLLVAASGLTALWLLGRRVASAAAATAAVLLTALSPTVFSQSAMAQLDIAAFALVLWMLYAHLCGKRWQAVAFAALAAVAKETTVAVTLTLGGHGAAGLDCAYRWWPQLAAQVVPAAAARWRSARRYLLALLPLVGWYAYHFHRTGHVFGNPDYLRYNVGATVTPLRILIALWMRLWHATGYMNLFVLTWRRAAAAGGARARPSAQTTSHIRQQKADMGHAAECGRPALRRASNCCSRWWCWRRWRSFPWSAERCWRAT